MKIYKSEQTIKRLLKHYRALCEDDKQPPMIRRFSQAMEEAIRYIVEDTKGWNMKKSPELWASILKKELDVK